MTEAEWEAIPAKAKPEERKRPAQQDPWNLEPARTEAAPRSLRPPAWREGKQQKGTCESWVYAEEHAWAGEAACCGAEAVPDAAWPAKGLAWLKPEKHGAGSCAERPPEPKQHMESEGDHATAGEGGG